MIADILNTGADNAITGRDLAALLGCDIRTIAQTIQNEREAGAQICANTQGKQGYYLAADPDELQEYCGRLEHREKEIRKTRRALLRTLKKGKK